jgi:heat shock protein HtpX
LPASAGPGLGKTPPPYHIRAMQPTLPRHLLERRRHRALNTVHTWLLAGGSLTLLAVTAYVFGGLIGVAVAIGLGALSLAAMSRASPQMVLSMYKASPVEAAHFPEAVAILRELARRAELPAVPKLYVVPSQTLNAFAVGRRDDSAIAITDALVRRLTMRELAGVLAHEVSHVAHEDVRVMAFADIVSRYTSVMSTVGILSLFINLGGFAGGYEAPVPWLGVAVLVAAPTIGGLLQLALSRTREFDADLGAAILTGDPDGLSSALVKLERAQRRHWESLMLPQGRVPDPSILRSHPPTEERIARLRAIGGGGPQLGAVLAAPTPRPSLVPGIRGRRTIHPEDAMHLATLIARPIHPPLVGEDRPGAVLPGGLGEPDGQPRIRLTRGGVWW